MRRLWSLVFLSTLASAAWAQIPTKGNIFFGYSYDRTPIVSDDTSNLNGWEATLEGKFLPWIGLLVDVDGHYGSHNFGGTRIFGLVTLGGQPRAVIPTPIQRLEVALPLARAPRTFRGWPGLRLALDSSTRWPSHGIGGTQRSRVIVERRARFS